MKNLYAQPVSVKPTPGLSKLGPNVSTDNTQGSVQAPSPSLTGAELSTELYTFFAKPVLDGRFVVLYNGDRQFARVTLTLETAGPVAVSRSQQLAPVLSGKGAKLETGVPLTFDVAKGNRLFVAATSISRIKVFVAPIPWQEQITGLLGLLVAKR